MENRILDGIIKDEAAGNGIGEMGELAVIYYNLIEYII